jgi:hypothetical protein
VFDILCLLINICKIKLLLCERKNDPLTDVTSISTLTSPSEICFSAISILTPRETESDLESGFDVLYAGVQ